MTENTEIKKFKVEEVYDFLKKRKERYNIILNNLNRELVNLRKIKEEEEMKACTFQPNSAERYRGK